jgi:hypothetical protein
MNKLETLNEIEFIDDIHEAENKNKLREEVKKHKEFIKKLESRNPKRKSITTPLLKWIDYFFNLGEEEFIKNRLYSFDEKDYLVEKNV